MTLETESVVPFSSGTCELITYGWLPLFNTQAVRTPFPKLYEVTTRSGFAVLLSAAWRSMFWLPGIVVAVVVSVVSMVVVFPGPRAKTP